LTRQINRSLFRKEAFHTLSWSVNPNNNGLAITGYRIYRKQAGEGDEAYQLISIVSGDVYAYVDGYLDVNEAYLYTITSVESSGLESGFSPPVGN
jgi:fibronectin type 3 domain-containing protein